MERKKINTEEIEMAETVISFSIFFITSIIMITIGLVQIKSKEPVGFYTGKPAPSADQLVDVSMWNRKHGHMWIIYGIAIMSSFLIGQFINRVSVVLFIYLIVIFGSILVMMWYHRHLIKRLCKEA